MLNSTTSIVIQDNELSNYNSLLKREYKKSNILIGAKYQSKLLDNQILAISLSDADNFYKNEKGLIVSALDAKAIIDLLGKNKGSFYQTLDRAADRLTDRKLGVTDPENNSFVYLNFIVGAALKDGIFYILYNPLFEEYLTNVKKNYTKYNLRIMIKFKTVYAFRLYELIKSQCFGDYNKIPNSQNMYHINFNLGELMLELGAVNAEDSDVKSKLSHKDNPDYNEALGIDDDKKITWGNFKKNLDKAITEINSSEDIKMFLKYDTIRTGKGGRVSRVIFTAEVDKELLNEDSVEETKQLTAEEKINFLDELYDLFEEKLKPRDYKAIAEAAHYSMPLIEKMYDLSKHQKKKIDNLVGWMIDAIEKDYSQPISATPSKPDAWDFEQRELNFDEIEAQLIDN